MEIYYLYNDERDEIEAIAKGYRNDVYVKTTDGMYQFQESLMKSVGMKQS